MGSWRRGKCSGTCRCKILVSEVWLSGLEWLQGPVDGGGNNGGAGAEGLVSCVGEGRQYKGAQGGHAGEPERVGEG